MSDNQMEYYRNEAKIVYAEVQRLEEELRLTGVQHKRQALRQRITEARLQWQVLNLHRENEELKADALGKAMATQVRIARNTITEAQKSIAEAGKTMASRLRRLAESLDHSAANGRYNDLAYAMLTELVSITGNSSFATIAHNQAEIEAAERILHIAGG